MLLGRRPGAATGAAPPVDCVGIPGGRGSLPG